MIRKKNRNNDIKYYSIINQILLFTLQYQSKFINLIVRSQYQGLMNILKSINSNWRNQQYLNSNHLIQSTNKISIKQEIKIIKLNNKRKHRFASKSKTKNNLNLQNTTNYLSANDAKQKMIVFIRDIRLIIQKILKDPKVNHYLQLSKTSQQEIKNNFQQYLKKFQNVLAAMEDTNNFQYKSNHVNNFFNNQQFQRFKSEEKYFQITSFNQQKVMGTTKRSSQRKMEVNKKVVNLLTKYFTQHMIPQTHWSNTDCQKNKLISFQAKTEKQICCLNNFSNSQSNFFNEKKNSQNKFNKSDQNSYTLLKKTESKIYQQIKRNSQQERLQSQNQGFLQRPIQQTLEAILKLQELKLIEKMSPIEKVSFLFDLQSKIYVASQFIDTAAYMSDDITTLPKQYYKNVWKYINLNQLGDQKSITSSYRILKKLMIITNASVLNQLQTKSQDNSFLKKIVFGLSFPRYMLQYNSAKMKNQTFLRNPTIKMTKSIWNLPQNGFLKQLKKPFIFQLIAVNMQLYIPRGYAKQKNNDKKIDIFTPYQNTIKVRLLNYTSLDLQNKNKKSQSFQTIIIHAHGGGFIALSSCTMQSYTRKWANKLKIPIFSIDYGKPPEQRFPTPVFDCLDVYVFISQNIHKFMNINPKRIILAGDSAGGNLVCSLNALIMRDGLHPVDSMFLAYPAVDTRKQFSPSRINSFNDAILYPTLLLLCMKQYLGDQIDYTYDPIANPILLTQSFINRTKGDQRWPIKWPKTIIVVGKKDPLLDDSIRLCERLSSSQIQFHCQIYKNLSHAFLSIDKMISQCEQTIKDSITFLQMLVQKKFIGKKQILD